MTNKPHNTIYNFFFLFEFFTFFYCSDMVPLPYATKENYKIMLYRLCDTDAEKVNEIAGFFVLVLVCV